nr:glycosyltransferase [Motilibacter deserti]
MTVGRVTPDAYARDNALRTLVDVVPFGVQDGEPVRTGPGFRERLGILPTDKVVLWGGGVWNWFDPLTLIRALGRIAESRNDVKLVFMGLKKPDPALADHKMALSAVELAKELGLYGSTVFFNYGWVPYEERQNHFLEADLGVSTHFDHLETRFSFRTRMLDYFWTRLPIVATEGDSIAELIAQRGLGRVVGYEDVDGLARALTGLLDDPEEMARIKDRLSVVREEFRWERVTRALDRQIDAVVAAPGHRFEMARASALGRSYVDYLRVLKGDNGLVVPARVAVHAGLRLTKARLGGGRGAK